MLATTCDLPGSPFNITETAKLYSQLCGILAGFAFTAILLPLTLASRIVRNLTDSVIAFACSFFSLILTTVAYAVLSGESTDVKDSSTFGRSTHEELVGGAALALSALLLLYGITRLVHAHLTERDQLQPAYNLLLAMTGVLGPAVALTLLLAGANDVATFRIEMESVGDATCPSVQESLVVDYVICGVGLMAILVIARYFRFRRTDVREFWLRYLPISVLALAVISTGYIAIFSSAVHRDFVTPELFQHVIIGIAATFATTFGSITFAARDLN